MAGRILDEDVATVRERARIEDVVGSFVTLRNAGGGALTGLCPFHDEKTPSFRVTPSKGFYYCFGCGEGGDVIAFVEKINNVSFAEAVQFLADRVGVQLRFDDSGAPQQAPGLRMRILEANQLAAEFFERHLLSPDALAARQFLDARGFDRAATERFGVGFAPRGGRELSAYLRGKGFTEEELVKAGLVRANGWDFFQGRLIWPIRDAGRSVLGFGARRLFDDDRMPAKYLNTPETPVYKKSQVLYGLDLARTNIAKKNQAVIVEGYTDVMAAHLSGVDTAVASCGTAFGDDHARLLQRLMGTQALTGEVIFTFDGDAAGQAAALKVFSGDQNFVSQTYVAVEPTGLDPCDLRIQQGEAAVRELVARRVPLYRFVMRNLIGQFDLDRADGRLAALRAVAPLVSSIRDSSLVSEYVREIAGMIGVDIEEVRKAVRAAPTKAAAAARPEPEPELEPGKQGPEGLPIPDPRDRRLEVERGVLKLILQAPECFTDTFNGIADEDFQHPTYRALFAVMGGLPEHGRGGAWVQLVRERAADPVVDHLAIALSVEPLLREPTPRYAAEYAAKLRLLTVTRTIAELKSKLQRSNPVDDQVAYNRMFARLLTLEESRRALQQEAAGLAEGF